MDTSNLILALLLGLGLSASTGLNTFLPLLLLSAAARFGYVDLNARFEWIAADTAIVVLIVACVVELIADKVPAVDHLLDGVATFLRPAAGLVATASVLTDVEPVTAAVVGLIIGSPMSFGFHTLKATTRVASSAVTFGCANPVISIVEDVLSLGLSMVAIFAPLLVPLLLLAVLFALWRVGRRINSSSAISPR